MQSTSWPRLARVRTFLVAFEKLQNKACRVLQLCVRFFGNIISKGRESTVTSALTGSKKKTNSMKVDLTKSRAERLWRTPGELVAKASQRLWGKTQKGQLVI